MIKSLAFSMMSVGALLLAINLYGLTKDIQPGRIVERDFRFENDKTLTYEDALVLLKKSQNQDEAEFSSGVTDVISKTLAHIHWKEESDPTVYHQRVPIWENYFIWAMSFITNMPEYEKYHYADYKRSLKRGIGICGDASLIMSQVLDENGIPNQMVSFPGHVILEAEIQPGNRQTYDPDFGVVIPYSIEEISASPFLVKEAYLEKGYSPREIMGLVRAYALPYERWDGVTHFMTKKYYFEKVAYMLKWPLPLCLVAFGAILIRIYRKRNRA